jgi:Tfp pilus assembly protein PilN
MIPAELKKWVAIGSGVGIEITGQRGAESLRIAAARVRPTGARVIGKLTIEDFPHQAAGVWGTEYAAFLRKLDLRHVPAVVLLPRQEVILRELSLPGVADKDLDAAIRFQLEGLHPYADDDVMASWSRLPGTPVVSVVIARRSSVERYADAFAEAGVKLAGVTSSAVAVFSALRLFGKKPALPILAFEEIDGAVEYYGESASHPMFSARVAPGMAGFACAELRIDPVEPVALESLVGAAPAPAYAAALASACPRHSLAVNLLPVERRTRSSRAMWIPAVALAVIVLALFAVWLIIPSYQDRRYERALDAEIAKAEPGARRAAAIERQIDTVHKRTVLLDDFRKRSKADMDVLIEMTRLLPQTVWLNTLELNRTQVFVAGEADQAAPLLKLIDGSPYFEASEFLVPPIRNATGETFRIRTNREAGR